MTLMATEKPSQIGLGTAAGFQPGDTVFHIESQDIYGKVEAVDGEWTLVRWDMGGYGDHRPNDARWAPAAKLRKPGN